MATLAAVPQRTCALLLFAVAVPQFYLLPPNTIDIPVSTVLVLFLALVAAARAWSRPGGRLLRSPLFHTLLGLIAIRLLALLWSPVPSDGRQPLVLLFQFSVTLLLVYNAFREDRDGLVRGLRYAYWPFVIAESALVVLFRLFPGVEDAYFKSIAGLFMGQNTAADLYTTARNNVLDPLKAGGVFVNANVAAMFLGVSALAGLAIYLLTRDRFVLVAALVALTAVLFTGSKSAIALAVALPLAVFGLYHWNRSLTRRVRRILLVGAGAVATLAILLVTFVDSGIIGASKEAFAQRMVIWEFGAESFRTDGLLGLGYGGWDLGFKGYAEENDIWRTFPPHSIVLGAWATTGLVGLALTVTVLFLTYRLVAGAMRDPGRDLKVVLWVGAALAWVWIQGMGENTDVFGSPQTMPIVALLLAYLIQPVPERGEPCPEGRYPAS